MVKTSLTTASSTLWKALFVAYGGPYAAALLLKIVQDCLAFLQPQLLRWLLAYISRYQDARSNPSKHEPPSLFEGFLIAFIMFSSATAQTVALNQVRGLVDFLGTSADMFGPNYSIFNVDLRLGTFLVFTLIWPIVLNIGLGCGSVQVS